MRPRTAGWRWRQWVEAWPVCAYTAAPPADNDAIAASRSSGCSYASNLSNLNNGIFHLTGGGANLLTGTST
ncbi:MAG: hypothetical protein FJW31_02370 [Acidobacteria bacterium]|nr:hypothetical protein [Acidobacteriota bacterium]